MEIYLFKKAIDELYDAISDEIDDFQNGATTTTTTTTTDDGKVLYIFTNWNEFV